MTWIFTPDTGETVDVADADLHCNYGFWLQKTTDEDGVLTYNEVETFAEFVDSIESDDVDAVHGQRDV